MILRALLARKREAASGEERGKRSPLLFFSPFYPFLLPARCPSDCPSSLFILTAFYPGGMINGFTEAPRYLSPSPSPFLLLQTPHQTPPFKVAVSLPPACIDEFSGFLRARLSPSPPSMAIVYDTYSSTPFLYLRCIALISRRHEMERLSGTERLDGVGSGIDPTVAHNKHLKAEDICIGHEHKLTFSRYEKK